MVFPSRGQRASLGLASFSASLTLARDFEKWVDAFSRVSRMCAFVPARLPTAMGFYLIKTYNVLTVLTFLGNLLLYRT